MDSATLEVRRLVVAALLDPASVVTLPPRDLDLTLRVLRRVRLLGRLGSSLAAAGRLDLLPQPAIDALQSAMVTARARTRLARWELDRLAWALADDASIQPVALKGCAYLLADLPNAAGRMFADVDLLLPEARLVEVEQRLQAHGWQSEELTPYDQNYYRVWTHELPPLKHAEREVEVDLHHNVLMRTARLHPDARLLLAQARAIPGTPFAVLAPIDMVLHAMTHLLYGGEMDDALRELVDIVDLLRHFGDHEPAFWQQFWARAVQLDLARPAFYGLRYAHRLLAAPVPPDLLLASHGGAPLRPALWLMDRLVPRALFPPHPDRPSRRTPLARWLLFVRSHWIRMPPWMLARHLAFKFYVRYLRRAPGRPLPSDSPAEKPG